MARSLQLLVGAVAAILVLAGCADVKPPAARRSPPPARLVDSTAADATPGQMATDPTLDWQLPDETRKAPFDDEQPIYFVNRASNPADWEKLTQFWTVSTEKARHPQTGKEVERQVVQIKVPLGLTRNPPVPAANSMTVPKWVLGKLLFYDGILSNSGKLSCASCHDPAKGFTDQLPVAKGGELNTPTLINAAYNEFQSWDGSTASIEEQVQAHVESRSAMFDSVAGAASDAWPRAVERIRSKAFYSQTFPRVFGTPATRDVIAKAIACYVRTLLAGNSLHDRTNPPYQAGDYQAVLTQAVQGLKKDSRDAEALRALGIVDPEKEAGKIGDLAKQLADGRALFFGKARCASCHTGDRFTDNQFHNLGVGFRRSEGRPDNSPLGRFARQALGQKNADLIGAFKTPTLRGLVASFPYMHDGSQPLLDDVVKFLNDGGAPNAFIDKHLRDIDAEWEYRELGPDQFRVKYATKDVIGLNNRYFVPLKLKLSASEQRDLVLFLKALQGDPVDPVTTVKQKTETTAGAQ